MCEVRRALDVIGVPVVKKGKTRVREEQVLPSTLRCAADGEGEGNKVPDVRGCAVRSPRGGVVVSK